MRQLYLTIFLILASTFHAFAEINKDSNAWTKTTISQDQTIEFDTTSPEAITLSGTITIDSGCKLTILNNSGKTITITKTSTSAMFSVKDGGVLEISGRNQRIILDGGANLTWSDYTLTPGTGSVKTSSSAISNAGTLSLSYVTIQNVLSSSMYNGAVRVTSKNGTTTIDHCTIQRCQSGSGAAIIINNTGADDPEKSKVSVVNSTVTQCITGNHTTDNSGGAIRTLGGTVSNLYLTNSTFSQNYARRNQEYNNKLEKDGNGGALFWNGRGKETTTCYIEGCTFTENKSDDNGGAIKAQGSIVFRNSLTTIANNTAPFGAGIFIEGYTGSVSIGKPCSITYSLNEFLLVKDNVAASYDYEGVTFPSKGAGIHFDFGSKMTLDAGSTITVNLSGASIQDNASDLGGGIYYEENAPAAKNYKFYIYLNHGDIINNTATSHGGGIYVSKGNVEYDNTEVGGNTLNVFQNHTSQNGAGIYIKDGSLEMAHGTIRQNSITSNGNGGGIYIENGNFTINAGEISGNTVSNGNGGGVYIAGSDGNGNFTMDGGVISVNRSSTDGGGVFINGGQFVQTAGSISSNISEGNGGGVCIVNGGTFTMSGGSITQNGKEGQTIHTNNGGGVYLNGGNFVLEDGEISNNSADENGGGVFLTGKDCTYELLKGDITGNSAGNGGGVYLEKGLFKLGTASNPADGNISDNTAVSGGGVYIGSGSISSVSDEPPAEPTEGFIMYGGQITGNSTTDDGGGIYLNGGSFLMHNGDISSNSSSTDGGGVCIANNGNFTMNNGDITGNGKISGKLTENGGGVYLDGGTLTVHAGNISGNGATASGGGVYISNGDVRMGDGQIQSNVCGEYGGGIYVYNPIGNSAKTVSVTGGNLLENIARYGGGICVNGDITLTIGNVEIAENTATNGGGVCLMNNANMTFGAGQIKNNRAVKSEGSQIYSGVTGFKKGIEEVEGLGGGIYLNSRTTLVFSDANELGLFGNTADNGADEIFANGDGTSVILPDVTGMKLDGYPGAGNLKWIEDYITNDTGYGYGTKLKGDSWNQTNIRYRDAISNNDQDNIFNLDRGTTEDDRTKYVCFVLGYEIIYITLTRHGLVEGESAVYTLSKSGTDESEDFSVILTGDGKESVSKKVAVTAGEWSIKETDWSWTYNVSDGDNNVLTDRSITKNIAYEEQRNFIFKGSKIQGLPMNAEAIVVKTIGGE